jgi:hypothetical protein
MQDQTPITWVDDVTALDSTTLNTEIRDACSLILQPPMCGLSQTTAQTIPVGTYFSVWTPVTFNSEFYDTEDPATPMHDVAVNNSRITITTPGWYECVASCEVVSFPTANIYTGGFRVNGSTVYVGNTVGRVTVGDPADCSPANLIQFNAGDYVEFVLTHDSSSTFQISTLALSTFYVARRRGI